MGVKKIEPSGILGFIGLASLVLWISVLIFGNYLIPVFYPSVVRAITFSLFAIMGGYLIIEEESGSVISYIFWTFVWAAFIMAVWRYGDEKYLTCIFWIFFLLASLIAFIVVWLTTKVERTTRAARKNIERAAKELEKEVKQFFKDIINVISDIFSIKNSVQTKCPEALKIQILEKKKNAVNVGIFGNNNVMIAKEEITSSEGVSSDIYKGQIIYC